MQVEHLCNASPARTSQRFPHSYFLIFTSYLLLFHRRHLPMPNVPGLRSCYDKVGRLVYFGRMLDKIRLHAAGKLPAEYVANLGDGQFFVLHGRCCRFLGVAHAELRARTLAGGSEEELLAWAHAHGTPRTDEECHMWN